MLHERALDLERADTISRALDDVVVAADETDISLAVAPRHVMQVVIVTADRFGRHVGHAVISHEQPRRIGLAQTRHANGAFLAVVDFVAILVEQLDVEQRARFAHRTRFRLDPRIGREQHGTLGLTEPLANLLARQLFPLNRDFRIERFASRREVLDR